MLLISHNMTIPNNGSLEITSLRQCYLNGSLDVVECVSCKTAPFYQLFALDNFDPPCPGMLRMEPGTSLDVEIMRMPAKYLGSFISEIPAPLGIGAVKLEDGQHVNGFSCEHYPVQNASNISDLGS